MDILSNTSIYVERIKYLSIPLPQALEKWGLTNGKSVKQKEGYSIHAIGISLVYFINIKIYQSTSMPSVSTLSSTNGCGVEVPSILVIRYWQSELDAFTT